MSIHCRTEIEFQDTADLVIKLCHREFSAAELFKIWKRHVIFVIRILGTDRKSVCTCPELHIKPVHGSLIRVICAAPV